MKPNDLILLRLNEPDAILLCDRNKMIAGVMRKLNGTMRVTRKVSIPELCDLCEADYLVLVLNSNLTLAYRISDKGKERLKIARRLDVKRRKERQ